MSLVGPRPIALGDVQQYEPWSNVFAALKPGVLGPWWLAGADRPTELRDEIAVDYLYARTYTLWLDFRILLRVLSTIMAGKLPVGGGKRSGTAGQAVRELRTSDQPDLR